MSMSNCAAAGRRQRETDATRNTEPTGSVAAKEETMYDDHVNAIHEPLDGFRFLTVDFENLHFVVFGRGISTGDAYDLTQTQDEIRDGAILVVPSENVIGVMMSAWPAAVTLNSGEFHQIDNEQFHLIEPKYHAAIRVAQAMAHVIEEV